MRSSKESAGFRIARLESVLLEELRSLLRDDIADPLLSPVRISSVSLSVDYRHLRIHYFIASNHLNLPLVQKALLRATPFLRAQLSLSLDLKRCPDLRFICDGLCPIEEMDSEERS